MKNLHTTSEAVEKGLNNIALHTLQVVKDKMESEKRVIMKEEYDSVQEDIDYGYNSALQDLSQWLDEEIKSISK